MNAQESSLFARSPAADAWLFLRRWLRQPLTVGAVAPSSPWLARAMVCAAQPIEGPVLELGPGTGVFTRALLEAGTGLDAICAVERVPTFAAKLGERFPGLKVIEGDAAALTPAAFEHPFARIVSGLPLRAMRESQIERILEAAFACARADARMVQFSYGLRSPIPRRVAEGLDLRARRVAWVARNLPPASVWVVERESPALALPAPRGTNAACAQQTSRAASHPPPAPLA
jgi:phosphatidylethanolamine/phosphatidyl-N-methylethanolamine N-methyltransferase